MNLKVNAVQVVPQPVPDTDELEQYTITQLFEIKARFVDMTTEMKARHLKNGEKCDETDQELRVHFPYEIGHIQDLMTRLAMLEDDLAELEGGFADKADSEADGDNDATEACMDNAVQREVKKQIKLYWRYISQLTHPDKLAFLEVVLKLGDEERERRIAIYHAAKKARVAQDLGTLMWLHASIEGEREGSESVSKLVIIREVRISEQSYQSQARLVASQEDTFIYSAYMSLINGTKAGAVGIYSQMLDSHIELLEERIGTVKHNISQHSAMPTVEPEEYADLDAAVPKYHIKGMSDKERDNDDYSDLEAEDAEFFSHVDD